MIQNNHNTRQSKVKSESRSISLLKTAVTRTKLITSWFFLQESSPRGTWINKILEIPDNSPGDIWEIQDSRPRSTPAYCHTRGNGVNWSILADFCGVRKSIYITPVQIWWIFELFNSRWRPRWPSAYCRTINWSIVGQFSFVIYHFI